MRCPPLREIAAYCLNELPDADAASLEEHYFECAACCRRVEGMQALAGQLGETLPHVLTAERRRTLEASGQPLVTMGVGPGERKTITFGAGVEIGFWLLRAPIAGAERVDLELLSDEGVSFDVLSDVPFDRGREEVVLACQTAYRTLMPTSELHVRIVSTDASGQKSVSQYVLDHAFDSP